jgi:hypothetical protein
MCQQVTVAHIVFDHCHLVARRNVFAAVPALFDVRRRNRQHVTFPDTGRESHPRMGSVLGWVWTAIHPDRAALLISINVLMYGDELMRDLIPFFPHSHLQWTTMNVFDDMDLALVLR